MFAVVRAGGAQFKVKGGDRIRVSFMAEKNPKDRIKLSALALSAGEDFFLGGDLKKTSVTAEVLGHGRGKKILVFKKKRRKGYRRTRGHRQDWTDLRITEIKAPSGKILFQESAPKPVKPAGKPTPPSPKKRAQGTGRGETLKNKPSAVSVKTKKETKKGKDSLTG